MLAIYINFDVSSLTRPQPPLRRKQPLGKSTLNHNLNLRPLESQAFSQPFKYK